MTMKYFKQLSSVEEQIIRLETVECLLSLISNGDTSKKNLEIAIFHIHDMITDINTNLSLRFDELWTTVRENDDDYQFEDNFDEEYSIDQYEEPEYSFNQLEDVMKTWAHSSEK